MGVLCWVCRFFHHYSSPSPPPLVVAVNISADAFVMETSVGRSWCEEAGVQEIEECFYFGICWLTSVDERRLVIINPEGHYFVCLFWGMLFF